jgi:hypothetical protein
MNILLTFTLLESIMRKWKTVNSKWPMKLMIFHNMNYWALRIHRPTKQTHTEVITWWTNSEYYSYAVKCYHIKMLHKINIPFKATYSTTLQKWYKSRQSKPNQEIYCGDINSLEHEEVSILACCLYMQVNLGLTNLPNYIPLYTASYPKIHD